MSQTVQAIKPPRHALLSCEEAEQRRLGIAAAVEMLIEIERISESSNDAALPDDVQDDRYLEVQDVFLRYMQRFANQSDAAKRGFTFVLSDHLFASHTSGQMYAHAHRSGDFHTNPPLTPYERIDREEAGEALSGRELSEEESQRLAKDWLGGASQESAQLAQLEGGAPQ